MKQKRLSIICCFLTVILGASCKKTNQLSTESTEEITSSSKWGKAKTAAISHAGGLLHTEADYERMRVKVNAGVQPWKGSWDKLLASPHSSSTWGSRATATIVRGGTGDNVALLYNDVAAAYQNALIWKITGNTANGDKARDILNHWSGTHTTLTGNADRYLASGLFGYQFANVGEMMKGYSGFDETRFKNYMLNVYYYPLVERFLVGNSFGADHNDACITNYWANWDLANMAAMLGIGILCDNQAIVDQGINYFKTGAGNGSILHAVPFLHPGDLGQWQESGRDQGHALLGVGLMASFCEMAWNQGIDMYGWSNSRFRMGAEYTASYNNGNSVPFTTYNWGSGTNCAPNSHTVVSSAGRGEMRPVFEMISAHYSQRLGVSVPQITQRAVLHRPEGGPGGHATTFDQPGYGSLTFYRDATSRPIANGTYSLRNRASGKMLDNYGLTTDGAPVKQYADGTSNNQKWNVTFSNGYYKLACVTGNKCLDSYNNTTNGSTVHQWGNGGSPNQQWQIVDLGNGYCKIFNRANGKCLDTGGGTADGATMQFWSSGNSFNQQWAFVAP